MTDLKGSASNNAGAFSLHKEWDELSCPICMEHPHNAVLLLCSSHGKGCMSYICDTSYRHSNCLDRFKKLRMNSGRNHSPSRSLHPENYERDIRELRFQHPHTSQSSLGRRRRRTEMMNTIEGSILEQSNGATSSVVLETLEGNSQATVRHLGSQEQERVELDVSGSNNATGSTELPKCPLCQGFVFGWKIIKEAREYLDLKSRSCSRESCSFSGNYRELRRHARRVHPTSRPADVESSRQRAWCHLEREREYGDILSAIHSAMPGAVVFGDYVVENLDGRPNGRESTVTDDGSGEPWWTTFFLFHMFESSFGSFNESRTSSRAWRSNRHTSGHRNHWGGNLLRFQDNHDYEDGQSNVIPSRRRRRRRFTSPRPDEELP